MAEVSDYTSLLYYSSAANGRWNYMADVGTQAVVTYSFVETADLDPVSQDPYGAASYHAFTEAQRAQFRSVVDKYEAAAGLRFVEVDGPAMVNVFGYVNTPNGSAAGWADIAWSTNAEQSQGDLAVALDDDLTPGQFGYEVLLHELGHSLGLKHPHDGDPTLVDHLDNQQTTVMTYEWSGQAVSELGWMDVQALQHIYGSADAFDDWNVRISNSGYVRIDASDAANSIVGTDQNTSMFGRGGADRIVGFQGDDRGAGGSGSDTLIGGYGDDRLRGGKGRDTLIGGVDEGDYSGNVGEVDTLAGGLGHDVLYGGYGDDVLHGGSGRDTLYGGNGDDVLTGGAWADVFVFGSGDYGDQNQITDFQAQKDKIDFSSLSGPGDIADLEITQSAGNTTVSYYSIEVELTGFTGTLTNDDFIFT